ncbi:MAG: tRNA (adenosine(37)-N6)-threonylcarbamoyltransferase complex dimerization subunit type 1 TsaB [Deltaproteobacteria bacterium]
MLPDPVILAFDTSAAHCAVALLLGERVVVSRVEAMASGQAERLVVMLQEVLTEAQVGWSDLTAIGVGIGPGNFTGIRISVSAARGLALGLGIPAIGVSTLEAVAFGHARPVTAIVDAKRGQVYAQDFPGGEAMLSHAIDGVSVGTIPLAEAIARIAATRADTVERPAPLYIREAHAAPSKIQAPRITA